MKIIRQLCPLALFSLLVACNTPRTPAPVTERGTASRPLESARGNAAATPRTTDQRGYYTVRKGDTLLHIAVEFGQSLRDVVAWNNLANANDIKVDQVLRVAPPETGGSVAPLPASVSVGSGVEVRPLGTAPGVVPGATGIPAATATPNKGGPKGEKRPYSDAALAELQRPESVISNTVPGHATAPARATEPRVTEKPAAAILPPPAPEDDNVSWTWPTDGKVANAFDDGKKGIDIAGKSGQPVVAASAGKVMYAGSGIRGYGNLVIVKHTSNLLSAYAHNKTILVKEGQTVTKGQKIAEMGNSDADAVKLHFEIRQQGKPVDPSKFLPTR